MATDNSTGVSVTTDPNSYTGLAELLGLDSATGALLGKMDPQMINGIAVMAALKKQKDAERTETPFPYPGKAMVTNNLAAPEAQYGPSGTIFTGGVPYKPNYAAQDAAAAGMLVSNVLESYKKNRAAAEKAQP